MTACDQLQTLVAEINDLLNTINILNWDARTQMPPGGAETRGFQLATLARIAQERHHARVRIIHATREIQRRVRNQSRRSADEHAFFARESS